MGTGTDYQLQCRANVSNGAPAEHERLSANAGTTSDTVADSRCPMDLRVGCRTLPVGRRSKVLDWSVSVDIASSGCRQSVGGISGCLAGINCVSRTSQDRTGQAGREDTFQGTLNREQERAFVPGASLTRPPWEGLVKRE